MSTQTPNAAAQATTGDTGRLIASFCDPSTLKSLAIVNKEFAKISSEIKDKYDAWKKKATGWSAKYL